MTALLGVRASTPSPTATGRRFGGTIFLFSQRELVVPLFSLKLSAAADQHGLKRAILSVNFDLSNLA